MQHVDATAEVHGRQVRVRRDEPEDVLELLRTVRIDLRGHARLREPQAGQLEQGRVTRHPLLEQCPQGRGGGGHGRAPSATVGIVKMWIDWSFARPARSPEPGLTLSETTTTRSSPSHDTPSTVR